MFKSVNKVGLGNFRPISTLHILSKILEKTVFQQLQSENSLLALYQSGFRANHSTQLAVTFSLRTKFRGHMDKELLTGAVLIDLLKAFDTVSHDGFDKLCRYGIQNQPPSWFENSPTGFRVCPLKIIFVLPPTSVRGSSK